MKSVLRWALSMVVWLAVAGNAAEAQKAPTIPGCECSAGTEIKYPDTNTLGKVYAANCKCGPQMCAVGWNKSISLQCTKDDALALSNCADFTKLPAGERAGPSERFGGFTVSNRPFQDKTPNLRIAFESIKQPDGSERLTPNMLRVPLAGSEFAYSSLYKTALVDLAYFGGDEYVDIQTGKNQVETRRFPIDSPNTGKAIRVTITHPDGIKKLVFRTVEVELYQVCAYDEMDQSSAAQK